MPEGGAAATWRQLNGTGLKRLHRSWRQRTGEALAPLHLLIDGIDGPHNLGAIIRTAAAYRVDHLWIAGSSIEPPDGGVQKTALGTDRYLPWTTVPDAAATIGELRSSGLRVIGIELCEGARPITQVNFAPRDAANGDTAHTDTPSGGASQGCCVVLGHESRGMAAATLAACDEVAYMPQLGKVGSLNLATAASLAMWEARRAVFADSD